MTKVLIVDDEKYVRMGIKSDTDWALIGCEVVGEASNGLEALEVAENTRPDLVVSDIRMPKMDGIELAEKLIEKFPGIKVIFLTAYNEFEYARQAVRIGVSDYLLKPFSDGELEGSIQRLLHLHPNAPATSTELEEQLIPLKKKEEVSNRYVQSAIEYIEDHYPDSDFSLGALAESMSVSEGHISRLFKSETDISINNYLTKYRIKMAMDYLKDVQVKVYEVAEKVGYQDIAYFSNTFKKLVGKTPSDYQSKGLE
ncbi:MAG: response regulator [Butyrivibrio sp.]|jgi:two-component system response regulator YesN|uniref:response regulator transcription factor n=1 Tax=Butyrivibrio sp. TaxID=28121 RepID=UPI001B4B4D6F|nr:response regulator [Butyrivibrio sp.]MBP3274400.1 response regulator [Butyrivibrio sp.]MBP3277872.1 response regulator [Butyrivibrio sp.]MBP3783008.1 response regulator [Butyrivibrio sp.]